MYGHTDQGNITPGSSASSQIRSGRHFHESLFLILLTNGHHKGLSGIYGGTIEQVFLFSHP